MSDLLVIYLDTSVLIDYCLPTESRHGAARKFIDICSNNTDQIAVYTSTWAWAEAHGVIYGKYLEGEGIGKQIQLNSSSGKKDAGKSPRTLYPPRVDLLEKATELLNLSYSVLKNQCRFSEWLPNGPESLSDVMSTARDICRHCAIYPPDSLHVAVALDLLASYFVATDRQLLDHLQWDKVYLQNLVSEKLRYVSNPMPPFEAVSLVSMKRWHPNPTATILHALSQRGLRA